MSKQPQNLNQAILEVMDTYAEHACFRIKQGAHYQDVTYQQLRVSSLRLAAFGPTQQHQRDRGRDQKQQSRTLDPGLQRLGQLHDEAVTPGQMVLLTETYAFIPRSSGRTVPVEPTI